MPDPATREEYDRLFLENTYTAGFGLETVRQVLACPFCAAPEWATWYIAEMAISDYASMRESHTCASCGRSAKFILTRPFPLTPEEVAHGVPERELHSELVQTGGDDPPPWLQPHPRRVG